MEVLLNLCWVLLSLPAYWILRSSSRNSNCISRLGVLRGGLALGCMLMLLFPFLSATDDLHAMRSDTEESSAKSLRDGSSDRGRVSGSHLTLAQATALLVLVAPDHVFGWISQQSGTSAVPVAIITRCGRAPPFLA